MPAAFNSLMRSTIRSFPIGSVQKAGHESEMPSEQPTAAESLNCHTQTRARSLCKVFLVGRQRRPHAREQGLGDALGMIASIK